LARALPILDALTEEVAHLERRRTGVGHRRVDGARSCVAPDECEDEKKEKAMKVVVHPRKPVRGKFEGGQS
jgi:hypothetical protein